MSRFMKAACFTLALLLVTAICLPLCSFDIMASSTDLTSVTLTDNGTSRSYKTGAKTVGAFFTEQNIQLYAKDQCDHDLNQPVTDGIAISIKRGINVNVTVDSIREKRKVFQGETVEQLITALQNETGIALLYQGDASRTLENNDKIELLTWRNETQVTQAPLPYETRIIETTAIRLGQERVRQKGESGECEITTAIVYIGGVEQSREVISNVVLKEPLIEIINVGIGGTLGTTTDVNSPDFQYIQKLTMNASAYTNGYESTGKRPGDKGYGITRSGLPTERGIVSVDPRVIPLGTSLYVEGYGYSLAADTGKDIVGNKIDLFFESLADALQFGRRNLTVYILE